METRAVVTLAGVSILKTCLHRSLVSSPLWLASVQTVALSRRPAGLPEQFAR